MKQCCPSNRILWIEYENYDEVLSKVEIKKDTYIQNQKETVKSSRLHEGKKRNSNFDTHSNYQRQGEEMGT